MVGVSRAPLIPQSRRGGDRRVPGRDLVSNNQKTHNPKRRHLYSHVHTHIRVPTYTLSLVLSFLHLQALCAQSKLERSQVLEDSCIYVRKQVKKYSFKGKQMQLKLSFVFLKQVGLKLMIFCLSPLSVRITDVCHHITPSRQIQ